MQGFIRVPNSIFEYELTPSELMTYCFLLSKCQYFNATTIKISTIAEGCGCSRNTSATAVNGLVRKGLLSVQTRYYRGYQGANRYNIANLGGGWFKLDKAIFNLKLNKSDFAVYLYILKCTNRSGNAFPSASKISSFTGVSEPRVRQAVKELSSLCLLRKKQQLKNCGSWGCNMFLVFTQTVRQSLLTFYRKAKRQPLMFLIRTALTAVVQVLRSVLLTVTNTCSQLFARWPGLSFFMRI